MAERLVLHIGAMKTGTSFVQSVLRVNQAVHDEAGFHFVGDFAAQARATRKVLAAPRTPARHGEWQALIEEARAFDGEAAIISMEFLSFAKPHQVDAFLRPAEGMRVQVVASVRDQFSVLAAQWQSYVRLLGTDPWDVYLRRIDPARQRRGDAESHAAKTFHRAQDVPDILARWSEHPVVESLDVVVVPPSGSPRERLWRLFAAAVGMPADRAGRIEEIFANSSMGYASCDVQRRINRYLQGQPGHIYRPGMRPLVRQVLFPRRKEEGKPPLDRGGAAYARDANQRIRDQIAAGGYRVHGSLDHLPVPAQLPRLPRRPKKPDEQKVREAAAALWDRCAAELGVAASRRPRRLEDQIADIARMVPQTPAWQEALRTRGLERS